MKKIVAFTGSNSSQSINGKLVAHAANKLEGAEMIQLTNLDIPMYGIDLEQSSGIPAGIKELMDKMVEADAVLISTPEHNGLMPAFFKNILDWLSRTGVKYLENTPVILMSSSPGNGGAKKAAEAVGKIIGYAGANIVGQFALPGFHTNFNSESNEIVDSELKAELERVLQQLSA